MRLFRRIRSSDILDEGVAVGVALVRFVLFALCFLPFVADFGEKRVGLHWNVVDFGQTKAVGVFHRFFVDAFAANNENFFVFAIFQRLAERSEGIATLEIAFPTAQHDVSTVR